ncbi:hypothetical protein GN244_ATG06122 [Phytophthora infestans]|uniref:Uncharacterized protein n=1 Tax=Phytophthora infestans TaxID=4787 RepID=A0A833TEZ2_PHYIN|nr:hypothetical protein GN244_ATG06122 [Phytophthora infestans]KAF4136245.1 hypothetical protein GN958_ATG14564 [Phytophthora infestans]
MARESKSAVPATPIKGGASRTTDRSAALIGERSVDFEDSDDDDDSQATDEDLGCGPGAAFGDWEDEAMDKNPSAKAGRDSVTLAVRPLVNGDIPVANKVLAR